MQLNSLDQLPGIVERSHFSIFELPEGTDFAELFPKAYRVKAEEDSKTITNESVKDAIALTGQKQHADFLIVIEQAENLTTNAANTLLKSLEETGPHVRFIFLVNHANVLLPTIRSRAFCYYLPSANHILDPPKADQKSIDLAKKYLGTSPAGLLSFAQDIAKDKKDPRGKATAMVDCAILLMYKSYFATGNQQFLTKLTKLLATQEALKANGNIKLQLVAGML